MTRIGLFFGSFNPIHIGHLIIAEFMATRGPLDKVWLVVSPHNPLKERKSLAPGRQRLHWARLAVEDNPKLAVSDIEFYLPKPSFTVDTLAHLKEKYPQHQFDLIVGGDNLATFNKWKNYEWILNNHRLHVYNRPGEQLGDLALHPGVHVYEAPLLSISATYIRQCLQNGESVRYLIPEQVWADLEKTPYYRS